MKPATAVQPRAPDSPPKRRRGHRRAVFASVRCLLLRGWRRVKLWLRAHERMIARLRKKGCALRLWAREIQTKRKAGKEKKRQTPEIQRGRHEKIEHSGLEL